MSRLARLLVVTLICLACNVPRADAVAIPSGVWLIDGKVAIQIYECGKLLCGRILWLQIPRDSAGALDVDAKNPTPSLRTRQLCGLTIIWGLYALGDNRWGGGKFYNPDDGNTYSIAAELVSDDLIVARIFARIAYLGQTKTLHRVAHGTSSGWC
ncbi:MAG: DUF2147 domain-containing protein [Devosia sp.]|nr:DUF2147 domain-containing protein [Devosia sp.]